jgi:hypothetical protein
MEFLLSHWHCILPAAGILVALALLRDKPADRENRPADRKSRPADHRP